MISKSYLLSVIIFVFTISAYQVEARQVAEEQEVYLTFRYQNAVNTYITAIYRNNEFYLPQTELFRVLQLDLNVNVGISVVSGQYVDNVSYRIDYGAGVARLGNDQYVMDADDYLIRELDYFIHSDVLRELFGLELTVNFNTLSLQLYTADQMPVVAQLVRARQRERTLQNIDTIDRTYFPLRYNRNIHLLNAGFIDYSLTASLSNDVSNYMVNSAIGMEVAGGDLQGSLFGNFSSSSSSIRSQNFRWQYGVRNTPWLSRITAGQTVSRGLRPTNITGIQITNDPIEPRYLYDDYVLSGSTMPNSEVELYRNNTLLTYQQVDDAGDYRFVVPLTYGTTRYNLRIYTPSGEEIDHPTRIQIPYAFNPPGEINYSLSAGKMDSPIPGTIERGYTGNGKATVGITNWLSVNTGLQYIEHFHDTLPTFTGGLSTRLFSNYLISVEAASQAFYRMNASVYYGSGTNINVDYTHYNYQGGLYNSGRNKSMMRFSFFTPITIGNLPLFFRTSINRENQFESSITRYRFELNSILGRMNIRIRYQDSQVGPLELDATSASRITASARYSFARSNSTPGLFRGMLLRGQASYAPVIDELIDAEIQASRRLLGSGRFQFSFGQNFIGNYNYFRVNLSFDFNSVRANSSIRGSRSNLNITQSIRGSIGLDTGNGRITASDRQQVGKSALAVRMFIDENENGLYDNDENLLEQPAIRVERAGGVIKNIRGINYISQLLPYRQYNLTVNKTAILNPLLVPSIEQFSFVSDPNQYKVIDIPLYYSGVIEGRVFRRVGETRSPLPGIRLILTETDHEEGTEPYTHQFSTFSDGSFYAWEIPPGDYTMVIDPVQLEFLQATTDPDTLRLTVRALAEGDFVTGLEMTVVPRIPATESTSTNNDPDSLQIPDGDEGNQENLQPNPVIEPETDSETESTETSVIEFDENQQTEQIPDETGILEEDELEVATEEETVLEMTTSTDIPLLNSEPVGPQVQLAAFSSLAFAQEYAQSLAVQHNLETIIFSSGNPVLFRVRAYPIPTDTVPSEFLQSLIDLGLGNDIYLVDP